MMQVILDVGDLKSVLEHALKLIKFDMAKFHISINGYLGLLKSHCNRSRCYLNCMLDSRCFFFSNPH